MPKGIWVCLTYLCGCGADGRAVASITRHTWFESSHRQFLLSVWNDGNNEKEGENGDNLKGHLNKENVFFRWGSMPPSRFQPKPWTTKTHSLSLSICLKMYLSLSIYLSISNYIYLTHSYSIYLILSNSSTLFLYISLCNSIYHSLTLSITL